MNLLFFLTPKQDVAIVNEEDSIRQALEKMEHHGYSAIPILNARGQYMGTITEGDILWYLKTNHFPSIKEMESLSIMDINRKRDNKAVHIGIDMDGLVDKALNQNFVPVVDDESVFIGIVTRKDLISYFRRESQAEKNCALAI